MKHPRKKIVLEIGVYILFVGFTTLLQFLYWSHYNYFDDGKVMDKHAFYSTLLSSFIQAFGISIGLFILYFINMKRLKNGKKPI